MTFKGSKMETEYNTTHSNNKSNNQTVVEGNKTNNQTIVEGNKTNNQTVVEGNLTCPETPPLLRGHLDIVDMNLTSLNLNLSIKYGGEVERGGSWRPKDCNARKKVAFLIPFRNRWEQLNTFLNHMHPVFQSQQLSYRIFVIEQVSSYYILQHK